MIDMEFETWPEDLVVLHLHRLDADIDLETQQRNQLNSDANIDGCIDTLQNNMTALTNNYHREPMGWGQTGRKSHSSSMLRNF